MSDNKLFLLFYYLIITECIFSSKANSNLNYPSFPARENGTCYKRVPYNDALITKISKGLVEVLPGSEQTGIKTSNGRGWLTIVDCCEGFVRNNETFKCETHCNESCIGGTCTGPNICTCEDGWRLEFGECKPMCRRECQEHAYCFSPEVCSCEFGYQDVNGVCQPVCLHDCKNGDCVAPRDCRCHPRYYLNETKMCEPVCDGGCPHGYCEKPGVCACNYGYVHPPNTRESCVPYCPDTCTNGICYSPGICTCNEGYIRDISGFCVPQCQNECINGKCIAPERCQCDSGFIMNQLQNCVEYTNYAIYENTALNNKINYQQNVHRKNYQQEIYKPTESQIPKRVIGLNETNQTQSTHRINVHPKSYKINEMHEFQGPDISQTHIPTQVSYTAQNSNQKQDSHEITDNYEKYENKYGQEHVLIKNHYIAQNPKQHVHEITDPYEHLDIVQTYEPQKTINAHEINQMPEAIIVITPNPVVNCADNCPNPPNQNLHRTVDHYQRHNIQTTNIRPSDMQIHLYPGVNKFSAHIRENVTYEINEHNVSESNESLNHKNPINNVHKPCNSEIDTNQESNLYNQYPYYAESHPTIIDDSENFRKNINTDRYIPGDNEYRSLCEYPCINGICIGKNQCQCKSGYKLDLKNRRRNVCLPFCHNGCLNGICSAPELCICNAGFFKEYGLKDSNRCITAD